MKSILKLQEGIYKQYSIYKYGELKRLSPEEYAMLEIYARVDPGSSWIELIPLPIINAVAEKVGNMTSGQILIGVASVAIASTICVVTSKVLNYKNKIKELEIQKETLTGLQKTTVEAQIEMIKAQTEFYKEIIKQTGASNIVINGETIEPVYLKSIISSHREKKENTQVVVSGSFKVTDIHIHDRYEDSTKDISLDIISKEGVIYKDVNIHEGLIDKDDYLMLSKRQTHTPYENK